VSGAGRPAPPVVDARGRRCPLPIIDLARRCAGIEVGATVELWADDPAAAADVAAWCRLRNHELVAVGPLAGGGSSFLVRRRG
jgi:tRNA 2-thiouridine synthesizing protein A